MQDVDIVQRLEQMLESRKGALASDSYVATLYLEGIDAILKKIGEEAVETIIAAKGADRKAVIHEIADLVFHVLIMLRAKDIRFDEVLSELARREGLSGLEEKGSRGKPE